MTTLREAAEQALECCVDLVAGWESLAPLAVQRAAAESLDALRAALAEPPPSKNACVYPQCVSTTRTQCEAWALGACEERTGWREAMGEDVAR